MSNKKRLSSIFLSWLIFIGIDFLFHASLFKDFWNANLPALKSLNELALLIPAGYFSFLLLTVLVGYTFFMIFKTKPSIQQVLQFGIIFSLLFSVSNILGLFSYIDLPLEQLLVFNLVYFVELVIVALSLYYIGFIWTLKKSIFYSISIFFSLIIIGIVIQNVFP